MLVNSAGLNARNRNWHNVTLEDWDRVIRVDLDGSFYCSKAVLPTMVAQRDGLIINVSSWAGKYTGILTGPAYSAAKHAMNSMTESLNMEAGIHGVRACALCPGEVATPILDSRPIPVTAEDKALMLQAEDCGEIIAFIARMPPHVCINELTVSPTWNRGFVAQAKGADPLSAVNGDSEPRVAATRFRSATASGSTFRRCRTRSAAARTCVRRRARNSSTRAMIVSASPIAT